MIYLNDIAKKFFVREIQKYGVFVEKKLIDVWIFIFVDVHTMLLSTKKVRTSPFSLINIYIEVKAIKS